MIEFELETALHAPDHIILERHAASLRRDRIFPHEVSDDILRNDFDDGPRLAVLRDRRLDPLRYLVRINFGRSFVNRPQIVVDADFGHEAFVEYFNWADDRL